MNELSPVRSSQDPAGIDRDGATAALLAAKDPEGLRRLLADHGGRIRLVLRKDYPVLDTSEIDDALNQAALRAWRAGHRYDPKKGTLRAWFFTITRNCALRTLRAKTQLGLTFVDNLDFLTPRTGGLSTQNPKRQKFIRELHRLIETLPGQQRAVILADLAAGGAADTKQLALDLDTTPNSIYVSRAKARKFLRSSLEAFDQTPRDKPEKEGRAAEEAAS